MPNEYRYGIHDGLSREELFLLVAIDETCKQLGVDDVVAVGAILAGQRFIPTRGKFNGAVEGTSVASVVSRRLLPYELEHKILPTVTSFESLFLLRIKFTRSLGVFVGRAIPGVGWVILAADVSTIIYRSVNAYNSLAKPEDRL
ncbi:STM2901 family protein [Trinickia sp. YCB016]